MGGGGYCHLYGLYGYVLLWGIWMGKWIGRVMHACKLFPDTNSVSLLLNYGIIFLSVPYYQGLEGVGGPYPALLHPIQFLSLSLYPAPPTGLEGGVGI